MQLQTLILAAGLCTLGTELIDASRANAAVGYRSGSCAQSDATSLTITRPAGTVAGDVLLASVGFTHGNGHGTPSGWTQVPNLNGEVGGDQTLTTWYRVAGSSEPASYTFTGTGSTTATAGGILSFSGVDPAAPIAGTPAQTLNESITTTDTLPNSSGSAVGSMRVSATMTDDMGSSTFSSGLTRVCDQVNGTGTDVAVANAYEVTGIGTTATRTVTRDDNGRSVLHTLVLAPIPCSAGGLNLSEPGSVSFPSVALDGTDKTTTSSMTLAVDDQTGVFSGWNLSATSTTFTAAGGKVLPTSATTITGVTPSAGSGRCAAPTSAVGYPVTLPAGPTAPTAAKIFNAAANTGKGPTNLQFGLSLAVPAYAKTGSYSSTWTFTLSTGP